MSESNRTAIIAEINQTNELIFEQYRKIRALREKLPPEEVKDYTLEDWEGKPVKLSEMFGDKQDLLVVHNMGKSCRWCTLWADGLMGFLNHIENRTSLVVVSKDAPDVQREFADSRNWKFRMLSAHQSEFTFEMGYANEKGEQAPGVSAFYKENDGKIYRVGTSWFGPGDPFCSVYHFFDLLKEGENGWAPQYKY